MIVDAKPRDLGLPTDAYYAVEEVHDVSPVHMILCVVWKPGEESLNFKCGVVRATHTIFNLNHMYIMQLDEFPQILIPQFAPSKISYGVIISHTIPHTTIVTPK